MVQSRLTDKEVTIYATYDDKNLYVAFRSVVSGQPKAEEKNHDKGDVCLDDAIEILLQPDSSNIFHFIGNSIGTVYDAKNDPEGRTLGAWDGKWNFQNKVVDSGEVFGAALTFSKSIWTAEIAIPFASLGVTTPKDGDCWRANFCRDWNLKKEDMQYRWTSWSPPSGLFSNPKGFGYLYFRENAPVVQLDSLGKFFWENDFKIRFTVANSGSKSINLCGDLWLKKATTGEEIVRKKDALTIRPGETKPLNINSTPEIGSSTEVKFDLLVRDLMDEQVYYRRAFNFVPSPSFKIESNLLYSKGIIGLSCSFKNLSVLTPSSAATLEVYSQKDNKLVVSQPFLGFGDKNPTGSCTIDITKLTAGQYVAKGYIKDGEKITAQGIAELSVPEKPAWWDNKLGVSDKVPAPWEPVKLSGNTISVWARDYKFANQPFPEQIITKGKPILSSPIQLEVATSDGIVTWTESNLKCVNKTDTKVVLKTENKSAQLDLVAETGVEFDGFIRVDLKLLPKKPVTIKSLILKIPFPKENALYMKGINYGCYWYGDGWFATCLYEGAEGKDGDTLTVNKFWHFSAKGWVWPEKFVHYVWVGDDERGLSVTFDSDRNWHTKKYVEVADSAGTKEIRFNLIGSDYLLKEPLDYTLALHATPVKPLPTDLKKWRYGHRGNQTPDGLEDMALAVQYNLTRGCGYPDDEGNVRPSIGLFEVRDAYRRLYNLFKTRVPDSCIFVHPAPMSPLASFVDCATEGEEWTDFKIPDLSYLTPDFFRCGFMMYQSYGIPFCLYPGLPRGFPKEVPREYLPALTLSCNIFPNYNTAQDKQIHKVMNDWYTTSEWIPYWKNCNLVESFSKDVKIGVYRKLNNRSLILVTNPANNKNEGEIKINLAGFGLKEDNYRMTNIGLGLPDEQVRLTGSKLSVSLPAHTLQFYLLEKR